MVALSSKFLAFSPLILASVVTAQTFRRLGTCPTLGCVFPPDQADFLPGALFDIRLEVHAPVNGTEAYNGGVPDEKFTFCIQKGKKGKCEDVKKFFKVKEAELEKWEFSYFEDLFARDAGAPSVVNVASKAYRSLTLKESGDYYAKLTYYGRSETVAHWTVREANKKRKAKNVVFFIGDGMTQPMVTAARMIGHKSINGKYQSMMQMDQMEAFGMQMTHSIDTFITDSANSASALYTGHKSSVDAVSVYGDSSPDKFDDPKVETIGELFRRRTGGPVGIVTTAYLADATPACLCSHTRARGQSAPIIYHTLNGKSGMNDLTWDTSCEGPDVFFGGGAEQFIPGPGSWNGTDFYNAFADKGYNVVNTKSAMVKTSNKKKTLGVFSISNLAKWLDRQVYPENLQNQQNSPTGDGSAAVDQPGLKDMAIKAIDILQSRAQKDQGWFLMAEAANIDKMMHALDYDRALGDLLELDDTIRATIAHLDKIGELKDTLIVITADHGHGFDVFGGVDTKYMQAQTGDLKKREAVQPYAGSGASSYQVEGESLASNNTYVVGPQGPNFPVQWDPRYVFAAGMGASPDRREGYDVKKTGPRNPTVRNADGLYVPDPADQPDGFFVTGTLPPSDQAQGVHSLTDVPVYASGPGSEAFRGIYNSIDIFYKIADALALGKESR